MNINWRVFRDLEWSTDLVKFSVNSVTLLAFVGFVVTGTFQFYRDAHEQFAPSRIQVQTDALKVELQQNRAQIAEIAASNERTNAALAELLKTTTGAPRGSQDSKLLQQEIDSIKSDIKIVQTSLDKLNSAILTTPEKALTLPLLRKDLDDLKIQDQRDVDAIRLEIGRAYDLNKWLIGFLLAAILGTILGNILQARSPDRQPKSQ